MSVAPSALARFVARVSASHAKAILALALVSCVGGAVSLRRLAARLETDSLALLPARLPALHELRRTLALFGSADRAYVLARPSPPASPEDAVAFLEEVGRRLPPRLIADARARVELSDLYLHQVLPHLPLYLDPEGQEALRRRLEPEAMAEDLVRFRRRLALPLLGDEQRLLALDPLSLHTLVQMPASGHDSGLLFDAGTGGLITASGQSYVLVARPRRAPSDIAFDQELAAALDLAIRGAGPPPGMEVRWGGAYLVALSDFRLMTADLRTNLLVSIASVAALFLLAFRSLRSLLLAFAPLLCAILFTFLLVDLAGLSLSSATLGFGAMLVGLGIDFSIVILGRHASLAAEGLPQGPETLAVLCGKPLRGVATGAITTAATFAALLASAFPALRQLGALTAVGILACLASVALVLMALLARARPGRARMGGMLLASLAPASVRFPRATLLGATALTAVLLPAIARVRLDDDLRSLRAPDNPGVRFEEDLARELGRATDSLSVLVEAPDAVALDARLSQALAALDTLTREGQVVAGRSMRDLLPSLPVQEHRLRSLRRLRESGALAPVAVRARLEEALRRAGLHVESFASYVDALEGALSLEVPLNADELLRPGPALDLAENLVKRDGRSLVAQILVEPAPGASTAALCERFRSLLSDRTGSTTITGFVLAAQEMRGQIRRDARRVIPLGSALVLALLWLDFRSVRKVILSCLPIGLGLLWMLGLMGLLGIPLNFFNLFVLALVQGIGVDYGVHLIHRIESNGLHIAHVRDVGSAVVLAALTTVAGFGSLALCHYPALASMGIVTTLGTVASLLAALTVVPALYALHPPPTTRRAGASTPPPSQE